MTSYWNGTPRTNRFPAVDEERCGADADDFYAPAGCLLVKGHAGRHGLHPEVSTHDFDSDICLCEHERGEHDDNGACTALTLDGRARCSCPSFVE